MEESDKMNANELYFHALKLMKTNPKELEKLFSKFLKKSYDLRFWNLYIEYVTKVSTKKVSINDVYAFVLNHFENSYFGYILIRSFIQILENEDLIRKIYQKALSVPMHNLGVLYAEYEKWEISVNRNLARSNLEKIQQNYNLASSTYQRLLPYLDLNLFFPILDIELENPLNLPAKNFENRLIFLFNYYNSIFPENEALLFLKSFYFKNLVEPEKILSHLDLGIKSENNINKIDSVNLNNTNFSTFLSYWFSFYYNKNYFNFNDIKNKKLTIILFLNWILKNQGIENFRIKFQELKNEGGLYAFVYAANVEFYNRASFGEGNKKRSYEIFIEGLEKHESPFYNEEFFKLFLKIGEEENIRLLFKKLKKTEKMYDLMLDYEFVNGEMSYYIDLLKNKKDLSFFPVDENSNKKTMDLNQNSNFKSENLFLKVYKSFSFLDLKIESSNILADFISQLPPLSFNENLLSNFDSSLIIDILKGL